MVTLPVVVHVEEFVLVANDLSGWLLTLELYILTGALLECGGGIMEIICVPFSCPSKGVLTF